MFGNKARQIEHLQGAIEEQEATIARLNGMLTDNIVTHGIARAVEATLQQFEANGTLREEATAGAQFIVEQQEKERMVTELRDGIVADHYDDIAASYRVQNGPRVKADLIDLFKTDGTFDEIADSARNDVNADLQRQVKEEHRAKVRAELESDENVESVWQGLVDEFLVGPEAAQVRREEEAALVERLRPSANEAARQQIVEEVAATESTRLAELQHVHSSSWEMRNFRDQETRRQNDKWSKATLEELLELARTDIERAAVSKRIAQVAAEAEEIEQQKRQEHQLEAFEALGLATSEIERYTKLTLYLGGTKATVREPNPRYYSGSYLNQYIQSEYLVCRRKLGLIALGEGRFEVVEDTLSKAEQSKPKKTRLKVIEPGTIIILGRVVKENGNQSFEQRLREGSVFSYDDDTTTHTVIETGLPITQLEIEGQPIKETTPPVKFD